MTAACSDFTASRARCTRCLRMLPRSAFSPDTRYRRGVYSRCRNCLRTGPRADRGPCGHPGCTKRAWARGYCSTHYNVARADGRSRVSAGCAHCYAEPLTARFSGEGRGMWGRGLAVLDERGARWTGKVELVESKLEDPLRWRKPQKIFVNSISDLFHENLDDAAIARVFATMALAKHHTFQVLTKRAARMREIVSDPKFRSVVAGEASGRSLLRRRPYVGILRADDLPWPLPNVWLGVSVEHQEAADERIPELLATPAAVRFLSCEPLLGPVFLEDAMPFTTEGIPLNELLHWVIIGGESGPGARAMLRAWAAALVEQCADAGIATWMKQLGVFLGGREHDNIDTFPQDLRVREFPRA